MEDFLQLGCTKPRKLVAAWLQGTNTNLYGVALTFNRNKLTNESGT